MAEKKTTGKKKWTGRSYGHDDVPEFHVFSATSIVEEESRSRSTLVFGCLGFGFALLLLMAIDGLVQNYRQMQLTSFERSLLQQEWSQGSHEVIFHKGNGGQAIQFSQLHNLASQYSFFSKNSYYFEGKKGFIYFTPTNLFERIFSGVAKQFQVAIILETPSDFHIPKGFLDLGVKTKSHKRFERLGLTYLLVELPLAEWTWFSRFITRKAFEGD